MGFVGGGGWFRSVLADESQRFSILVFLRLVGVNAAIYFLATVKARKIKTRLRLERLFFVPGCCYWRH